MVTATMLTTISARLSQATDIKRPFGGIPVFMFGDFAQINPVHGKSLPHAVIGRIDFERNNPNQHYNPLTNENKGIDLFLRATWFQLKQQVRCAQDRKHLKFVEKLGAGKKIKLVDMRNYDILSREDVKYMVLFTNFGFNK